MTATTNILYPLARSTEGRAVHVSEAVKGQPYECFGCSAPMVIRRDAKRQEHFAHKPPFERCAEPDKALHDAALAMMERGFHDALEQQNEYHLGCPCEGCGRVVSRNIALPGASVETEKSIVAGTRSDLVVTQPRRSQVAIEVVVTHDLEPEAHDAYTQSGIPVFKVRPTWETVTELQFRVTTNDTLNVPPIQCAACKAAEERRRREAEEIRDRVGAMLQRMDLRRPSNAPNLPFVPWMHDKYGRPMYPHIRQQVYRNAIILTELGFVQTKRKPWLFWFPLPKAEVFANFGSTDVVPIYRDTSALIHWSMEGYSDKLEYALVEGVLARCRAAGAAVRVDFYHGGFDRGGNHEAKNGPTDRVDKAMLGRLLAQANQSFPEAERQRAQARERQRVQQQQEWEQQQQTQRERRGQDWRRLDEEHRRRQEEHQRRTAEWEELNEWLRERRQEQEQALRKEAGEEDDPDRSVG